MTKMMHIGEAIRYVRTTSRLKIEMVAQEAGCAASNLSRIENGRQRPSVTLLESLACALQTPVSELYQLLEMHSQPSRADEPSATLSPGEWLRLRQALTFLSSDRRMRVQALLDHLLAEQKTQVGSQSAVQANSAEASGLPGQPLTSRRVA